MNRILLGHRVVHAERRLIGDAEGSHWAVCVEYLLAGAGEGERGNQVVLQSVPGH